jgi:hypothetical protein
MRCLWSFRLCRAASLSAISLHPSLKLLLSHDLPIREPISLTDVGNALTIFPEPEVLKVTKGNKRIPESAIRGAVAIPVEESDSALGQVLLLGGEVEDVAVGWCGFVSTCTS